MEERSKLYGSTVSVSSAGWRVGRDLKCSLPEENYHYNNLLRTRWERGFLLETVSPVRDA